MYTHSGQVYPALSPSRILQTRINFTTSANPTFSWDPVPNANRYRLRIYNYDSSETLWNGFTQGAETFCTVPPDVLKPNSQYRFRLDARDAKNPLDNDNMSKTPASNNDNFLFNTDEVQPTQPYIDPDVHGVYISNSPTGSNLGAWVIIRDAQGVPGDIKSVKLTHPDGTEESLNYFGNNPYIPATPTKGVYNLNSSKAPENDEIYTITVEDLEGNTAQYTERLTVDIIGYPHEDSLSPKSGTVLGSTGGTFSWAPVSGAAIYRLEIYDKNFNRIYFFDIPATETQIVLPPGLLNPATTYSYRVQTRRELFADDVDNLSSVPGSYLNAIPFSTTKPAETDTDGDGLIDIVETNTGVYVSPTNTGTDPNKADTDGDGYTDLHEIQAGTNPNSDSSTPAVTQLYVEATGDDKNLGDAAHPLKTLHGAVSRANASPEAAIAINLMAAAVYSAAAESADTPVVLGRNMTINGNGARIDGSGATGWAAGLTLSVGAEKVTIQGLTIQNFKQGLAIQSDGGCITLSGVAISACEIGIELAEAYQLDLDLGTSVVTGCGIGVKVTAGSSNTTVLGGEVRDSTGDGIRVESSNQTPDEIRFEDVRVLANTGNGIALYDGAGHTVTGCTVAGNNTGMGAWGGIAVFSTCTRVNQNEITGNQCLGIYAAEELSTAPVDATENWWGDASGPSGAGPGSGNAVSERVDFEPWLGMTPAEDSDFDGLPDDWEQENFGGLSQSGQGDFDGDGWSNLGEFQAGTDPADRNAAPAVAEFTVSPFGQDHNLGDAVHPLKTLHGALKRVNGVAEGSYVIRLSAGVYSANALAADVVEPNEPAVLAADVTIMGAGQGATVLDGAGAAGWSAGLTFSPAAERVTLRNMTIRNFTQGLAIQSEGGCLTLGRLTIKACETGVELAEAYQLDLDLGDSVVTGCGTGVKVTAGSSNVALRNGEVSESSGDGVRIEASNETPDQISLEAMLVAGNVGHGIVLYDGAGHSVTDCTVADNNTGGNAWGGIAVFTACTRVSQNAIEGNQCMGLYADDALSTEPLDAAYNWWGDDSGPFNDPANLTGSGDAVSDNVFFQPWLGYSDSGGYVPVVDDNDNGLLDPWEEQYFGSVGVGGGGSSDYDGDGLTNAEEQELGYNPASAVDVLITTPAKNPFYTGGGSGPITLAGTCHNAGQLEISRNGTPVATLLSPASPWSLPVPVVAGSNEIVVTATVAGGTATTKAEVTVVVDNQAPSVSIELPTPAETYTTSLVSLALGGMASDNSGVASVSWTRTAGTEPTATGSAAGTTSWTTSPIPLVAGKDNVVTVTVKDLFGNYTSSSVTITRKPATVNESSAPPAAVAIPPAEQDPLDLDGDNYQNDDETVCGSDPSNEASVPYNTRGSSYPMNTNDPNFNPTKVKKDANSNIIGAYLWPDCLNPDDDGDGMPDAWEVQYGFDPHNPDDAQGDADLDGISNLAEFKNGTDPTKAPTQSFSLKVLEGANSVYDSWLPGYNKVLTIQAAWTGTGAPANLVFALKNTSAYPGRAVNDPDPVELPPNSYPGWYQFNGPDFGLTVVDPATNQNLHSFDQGPVTANVGTGGVYTVYLQCWDYGGRTRLVASHPTDPAISAEIWIPMGSGANGIGSAWEYDKGEVRLDPNADKDALVFHDTNRSAPLGDSFNNFEEYRGIVYTPQTGAPLTHLRLNPLRKDLFVRAEGFDDAAGDPYRPFDPPATDPDKYYPFRMGLALQGCGVVVHNTTGWGHDATEGGGFFRYYSAGTISGIADKLVTGSGTGWGVAWPGQEWEFKLADANEDAWTPVTKWLSPESILLDRTYVGGASNTYQIRMSMPHINVLVVRLDKVKKGVFTSENGRIIFLGASPPSPDNPTGSRHWAWTTKGHARESKDPASYGVAEVLKIPLDHYFDDRPYAGGTIWGDPVQRQWNTRDSSNRMLMPLSRSEDPLDAMAFIDGFNDLGMSVMLGNLPNGIWDGDRRLPTYTDWDNNTNGLTPFDIDGNGSVELPVASDPHPIDDSKQHDAAGLPYTRERVLKHSITHEICHILAKTAWHSADSTCVMYMYSNNWKRDDNLSDDYRELLEIHNKRR
jgi:hypothetical protein